MMTRTVLPPLTHCHSIVMKIMMMAMKIWQWWLGWWWRLWFRWWKRNPNAIRAKSVLIAKILFQLQLWWLDGSDQSSCWHETQIWENTDDWISSFYTSGFLQLPHLQDFWRIPTSISCEASDVVHRKADMINGIWWTRIVHVAKKHLEDDVWLKLWMNYGRRSKGEDVQKTWKSVITLKTIL